MFISTRSSHMSTRSRRVVLGVAATILGLSGALTATGAASAAPSLTYGSVPYTPTITTAPGVGCSAVIGAVKLPQTVANQYRVKVRVQRFGTNCGVFKLSVDWRNATRGGNGGQIFDVNPDGSVQGAPDNVLDGFGFYTGAGIIDATIHTYSKYDEEGDIALPNIPGKAVFAVR